MFYGENCIARLADGSDLMLAKPWIVTGKNTTCKPHVPSPDGEPHNLPKFCFTDEAKFVVYDFSWATEENLFFRGVSRSVLAPKPKCISHCPDPKPPCHPDVPEEPEEEPEPDEIKPCKLENFFPVPTEEEPEEEEPGCGNNNGTCGSGFCFSGQIFITKIPSCGDNETSSDGSEMLSLLADKLKNIKFTV